MVIGVGLHQIKPRAKSLGFGLMAIVLVVVSLALFGRLALAGCSASGDVCVTSISPEIGPTTGGTGFGTAYDPSGRVTITGSGFLPPASPGSVVDFGFTGAVQTYSIPASGRYQLEVWGAQGGNSGGKGGYSTGATYLTAGTLLNVHVGGEGAEGLYGGFYPGGFNGGGASYGEGSGGSSSGRGSGGGGTDVRVGGGTYYHRLIVAGGGGGNTFKPGGGYDAGYGGGVNGGNTQTSSSHYIAIGGTQVGPGAKSPESEDLASAAGFGFGASITSPITISGGGGGWYGGGTGHGGAGGSGWVYTASSFATWQAGNPADAAGYQVNSKYYLSDTQMLAGNQTMPGVSGGVATGRSGNGAVRITSLTSWSVKIGGQECADIEVISDTELSCVPPAGAVGVVDVEVIVSEETAVLEGGYTYQAPQDDEEKPDARQPVTPGVPNTGRVVSGSDSTRSAGTLALVGVAFASVLHRKSRSRLKKE